MTEREILKKALTAADAYQFGLLAPDTEWVPSDDFNKRQRELIERFKKQGIKPALSPRKKLLAAVAAVVLLFGISMAVPSVRKTFFGLFGTGNTGYVNAEWYYDVCEDETLEITGYTGTLEDVTVPGIIDGKTVTKIKSVSSDNAIKSVILPETVTVIENNAFEGCKRLTEISIPSSVREIGDEAFEGCISLKTVYYSGSENEWGLIDISNDNEVLNSAKIRFLISMTTSNTDTTSGTETSIASCAAITATAAASNAQTSEAVYPSAAITAKAAASNAQTSEAVYPSAAETSYQTESTEQTHPSQKTEASEIKTSADTTVEPTVTQSACDGAAVIDRAVYEYNENENTYSLISYSGGSTTLTVPESINGIPVTSVASGAFSEDKVRIVELPGSIKRIEDRAFYNAYHLLSVVISEGTEYIGDSAFEGCKQMSSLTLPDSVTYIGKAAFKTCIAMKTAKLPSGTTVIREKTFSDCAALTAIDIPFTVNHIGKSAFRGCVKLKSISIPNRLTELGDSVFMNCSGLKEVSLPGDIAYIPDYAFSGCDSLEMITIPSGVKEIGMNAFASCRMLKNMALPDVIVSIGPWAFKGCVSLSSLFIPGSLKTIGKGAVSGCTGLTLLTVGESDPYYSSNGNCIIETKAGVLVLGCDCSVIPDDGTVKKIGAFAFAGAGFEEITIPDGVKTVASNAFEGCTSLKTVTLPKSLNMIQSGAFNGCTQINTVRYCGTEQDWKKISGTIIGFNIKYVFEVE